MSGKFYNHKKLRIRAQNNFKSELLNRGMNDKSQVNSSWSYIYTKSDICIPIFKYKLKILENKC